MATRTDVAKLAGVAEATVSYAISGKRPISAATRERVFAAMATLDYRPNVMAQGLAGQSSTVIALLFPDQERSVSNVDLEYGLGAASAARELGYHLLLWPTDDGGLAEVISLHRAGLIGGVILMEVRLHDERIALLNRANVPVTLIGRTGDGFVDAEFADRDFDVAAGLAVDHLVELGHKNIALLSGSNRVINLELGAPVRAESSFLDAVSARGIRGEIIRAELTIEAGYEVAEALSSHRRGITALVCMNIEATVGIIQRAATLGLRVPEDISVISIATPDSFTSVTVPSLTTVSPPATQIGRAAARMLIRQISGSDMDPGAALWGGELTVRESTGPAPW